MKVLLINGSPHINGCTNNALEIVATTLNQNGITTQIMQLGNGPIQDCIACNGCRNQDRCVFNDDAVNQIIAQAQTADAFVFGTPVYYAHPSGRLLAAMDRLFYAGSKYLHHKPAAIISTARRAGTTATMDVVHKYFAMNQMPIVTSTYWNHLYRDTSATGCATDAEGRQTLENLAHNFAWLLKSIAAGKQAGITPPNNPKVHTNFVRE